MDYYTEEQRTKIKDYLSRQRWKDAESGVFSLGNHEIGFDENGNMLTAPVEAPDRLPEDADPVFAAFYHYYAKRARHPRAVNFVTSWTATSRCRLEFSSDDQYQGNIPTPRAAGGW